MEELLKSICGCVNVDIEGRDTAGNLVFRFKKRDPGSRHELDIKTKDDKLVLSNRGLCIIHNPDLIPSLLIITGGEPTVFSPTQSVLLSAYRYPSVACQVTQVAYPISSIIGITDVRLPDAWHAYVPEHGDFMPYSWTWLNAGDTYVALVDEYRYKNTSIVYDYSYRVHRLFGERSEELRFLQKPSLPVVFIESIRSIAMNIVNWDYYIFG